MASNFRLVDKHILAATVYDETTGQKRESTLDLDYCISRDYAGGDHSYFAAARAPKSFSNPHLEHTMLPRWKLSDIVNHHESTGTNVTVAASSFGAGGIFIIHIRAENFMIWPFPNKVADSAIHVEKYIRCTKTGRLEWMHPPYASAIPEWLETVLNVAGAMSKVPGNAFEMAVDLAKDQLTEGLVPEVRGAHKEWMKDTYVDNGQLIRHGT